jgi:hypothetical protein
MDMDFDMDTERHNFLFPFEPKQSNSICFGSILDFFAVCFERTETKNRCFETNRTEDQSFFM